jgi:phospholipid-binding lipoprotein MlaA
MFSFDQALDAVLIRPIAWTYREVVPLFIRKRISLVLENVRAPVTLVNDVLQGEGTRAGQTLSRIMINTTIGLGGMFDVASSKAHIPPHTEDFGQTLTVWGVGEPTYLYLPVLGPSGVRDGFGLAVDSFLFDPIAWYSYNPHNMQWVQYAQLGLTLVDVKSSTMDTTDELKKSSIDYYAALRSTYRQYKAKETRNGRPAPADEMPGFDDEDGDPFAAEPETPKTKP